MRESLASRSLPIKVEKKLLKHREIEFNQENGNPAILRLRIFLFNLLQFC